MLGIPKSYLSYLAVASGLLNLVGAVLLFYSFQVASSDFKVVTFENGDEALCIGRNSLFRMNPNNPNSSFIMGSPNTCPEGANVKPTAVINTDHPGFVGLGFALMLFGFLAQLLSIEPSMLTTEELRTLRKARKLLD